MTTISAPAQDLPTTGTPAITASQIDYAETFLGAVLFHRQHGYAALPQLLVTDAVQAGWSVVVDNALAHDYLEQADRNGAGRADRWEVAAKAARSEIAARSYSHGEHIAERSGDL